MASDPDYDSEAWLRMMAQAMQGTVEAQKVFADLARSPEALSSFQRWLALVAPGVKIPTATAQPDFLADWVESWQQAMGVVSRTRFLAALEKIETLERRIRELEKANQQLRSTLEQNTQQAEATEKMVNLWGQFVEDSLKTQAAWIDTWADNTRQGKQGAEHQTGLDEEE